MPRNWMRWVVTLAVIIAVLNAYLVGKRSGAESVRDAESRKAIASHDDTTKRISARVDSAKKNDAGLIAVHDKIRERIKVVHDTIEVGPDSTGEEDLIVSPQVASLIAYDDSVISAQKREIALQDTLIAALRKDVSLRDTRIKLLEQSKESRTGKILAATKYIAIGALLGAAFLHK